MCAIYTAVNTTSELKTREEDSEYYYRYIPSPVLAIVILCSIAAAVVPIGMVVEDRVARAEFIDALQTQDPKRIEQYLKTLLVASYRTDLVQEIVFADFPARQKHAARESLYHLAFKQVIQDHEALKALEDQIRSSPAYGVLQAKSELLKLIQGLKIHLKERKRLTDSIAKLSEVLAQRLQQHRLVALDTENFFNVRSAYEEEEEYSELLVYQSGVLAGLPKLRDIPDDIVDLTAFKEILDKVGGNVTIEAGEDQALFFNQRLNALKESSLPIVTEFSTLRSARQTEESKLIEITKKINNNERLIREKAAQTIAEL